VEWLIMDQNLPGTNFYEGNKEGRNKNVLMVDTLQDMFSSKKGRHKFVLLSELLGCSVLSIVDIEYCIFNVQSVR
jgi:hypothetical protein